MWLFGEEVSASSTVFVSCLSNPSGPVSDSPCFLGQPHQLDRSLLLSGRLSPLLLRHIIQCRHHGTFLAEHRSACQAANTVRSTVPTLARYHLWRCSAATNPRPARVRASAVR
jgi:hypothetical protein